MHCANAWRQVLALAPGADETIPTAWSRSCSLHSTASSTPVRICWALPATDPEFAALRPATEKLSALAFTAQRALADAEEIGGVNAIFLAPQRLAVGVIVVAGALLLRVPAIVLLVLAGLGLAVGYRWYTGFRATEASLAKLRLFVLHGKTFLRTSTGGGDKPQGGP